MGWATFHNRRAVQIEDDSVRVTVTTEGGHIAEILHKASGVSPLWIPPWPSIEPSTYSLAKHPEYGADAESKLLSGIMGQNLCLDLFGSPSAEEAAAGMTVHGEASVATYKITFADRELTAACSLPAAQLQFERRIRLDRGRVRINETVENISILDRPIAWTQHATLGPPFLEKGVTQFRAPGTKAHTLSSGQDFDWPIATRANGGKEDLQVYTNAPASGSFDTVMMDPHRDEAFFFAYSPKSKVLFGYVWKRADFPWLGIWDENYNRKQPPWNGRTLTRGMEFGASPIAESRRKMIDRHALFGVPAYRWIPAKTKVHVDYWAFITTADSIPNSLEELQVHVPA
ncbi:MAG TPA: hypothetical protein VEU96_14705 [Bryobacteraceae bacterium]|nr:hypothetical protein [Bryobacteraceae bacterium]